LFSLSVELAVFLPLPRCWNNSSIASFTFVQNSKRAWFPLDFL
jgi:hypothetical protein